MISTGAFLNEMDASNKQPTVAEKFAAVWEKKNAKAARAGGVSLMALSLAACGSSSDDTETPVTSSDNSGVTPIASDLTNGSDQFTGTSGNDTITAGAVYTPGGNDRINSLQDEDVISGGAGDDTINITVTTANDNGNNIITPTMTSVENVNVNFATSGATDELDFQDVTGVVDLALTRVSTDGTVTIDNIQDVLVTLTLSNSGEDTDTIDISFDDDVLIGTTDSLALTVDDVEVASLNIQGEDEEGYETVNMTAAGDISVATDFELDSTTSLVIDGAGDVTVADMTVSAGHLHTIDASAASGDMDFDLGAANVVEAVNTADSGTQIGFTYKGSKGSDTIRIDETSLSDDGVAGEDTGRNDTIGGGDGADTLYITVNADTAHDETVAGAAERNGLIEDEHTVTSIETLRIDAEDDNPGGGGDTETVAGIDASLIGGLTTVELRNVADDAGDSANFDVINLGSAFNTAVGTTAVGVVKVFHAQDNTSAETVGDTDVRIHLDDASGTADHVTVSIETATNTTETFNFTLDVDGNDSDEADLDDEAVESLTIIDNDTENNTVDVDSGADHTGTLTLTGGRADDTFTLTAPAGLETVTINAAGQLSDVTLTVGTADQTITMGSGDDEVTFEAVEDLDESDTLDGGDGTDTLITGISADHTDELNSTNFEILKIDADASHVFDITDSDEITTVVLMSDDNDDAIATAVTAGVIDLEADAISTIRIEANSDDGAGAGAEVANGLDLSTDNTGSSMAIETTDSGNDSLTIGVITLDDDVTTLTVSNADDDDAAATTFNEISAAGLTSLTISDGYLLSDADSQETVIDLDDTAAITSIDAAAALGGVNLDIDDLGADATINLVQADDVDDDAADVLTIAITGGTTANNLTINDGGAASSVTITSGDFDGLTINMGGGNDTVTLTGAVGDGTTVNGDAGNDILIGHNDDDVINGGAGNDYIRGGTGTDTLSGNAGNDNFVFHNASSNSDTIDDWTAADDVIVFGADEATNAADVFDAGLDLEHMVKLFL